MKDLKRNKAVFEYTTEELDLEHTRRVKELSKLEYFIYMTRGHERDNTILIMFTIMLAVVLGYILGGI